MRGRRRMCGTFQKTAFPIFIIYYIKWLCLRQNPARTTCPSRPYCGNLSATETQQIGKLYILPNSLLKIAGRCERLRAVAQRNVHLRLVNKPPEPERGVACTSKFGSLATPKLGFMTLFIFASMKGDVVFSFVSCPQRSPYPLTFKPWRCCITGDVFSLILCQKLLPRHRPQSLICQTQKLL